MKWESIIIPRCGTCGDLVDCSDPNQPGDAQRCLVPRQVTMRQDPVLMTNTAKGNMCFVRGYLIKRKHQIEEEYPFGAQRVQDLTIERSRHPIQAAVFGELLAICDNLFNPQHFSRRLQAGLGAEKSSTEKGRPQGVGAA